MFSLTNGHRTFQREYYLFTNEENTKENHHVEQLPAHGENNKPPKLRGTCDSTAQVWGSGEDDS